MAPYFETGDGRQLFHHAAITVEDFYQTREVKANEPALAKYQEVRKVHHAAARYAIENRIVMNERPDDLGEPCVFLKQHREYPHLETDPAVITQRLQALERIHGPEFVHWLERLNDGPITQITFGEDEVHWDDLAKDGQHFQFGQGFSVRTFNGISSQPYWCAKIENKGITINWDNYKGERTATKYQIYPSSPVEIDWKSPPETLSYLGEFHL